MDFKLGQDYTFYVPPDLKAKAQPRRSGNGSFSTSQPRAQMSAKNL